MITVNHPKKITIAFCNHYYNCSQLHKKLFYFFWWIFYHKALALDWNLYCFFIVIHYYIFFFFLLVRESRFRCERISSSLRTRRSRTLSHPTRRLSSLHLRLNGYDLSEVFDFIEVEVVSEEALVLPFLSCIGFCFYTR